MIVRRTTEEAGASTNAMLGLSGLDSASMLKQMMEPYKIPIRTVSKRQQLVIWKQERYREIITKLDEFQAKYFDGASPDTYLGTAATWKKFIVTSSDKENEYVKITTTKDTKTKTGTIAVNKMPTATKVTGRTGIVGEVIGNSSPRWTGVDGALGRSFTINMDGIVRTISITSDIANASTEQEKVDRLQGAIDAAFGAGAITVSIENIGTSATPINGLKFEGGASVNQFTLEYSDTINSLGFGVEANRSNKLHTTDTLTAYKWRVDPDIKFVERQEGATNTDGDPIPTNYVEFSINGVAFKFPEAGTTIQYIMDSVNNSPAGVKMAYDNVKDCFTMEATICGPGATIVINEEIPVGQNTKSTFFSSIGLTVKDQGTADGTQFYGGYMDSVVESGVDSFIATTPLYLDVTINGVTKKITVSNLATLPPTTNPPTTYTRTESLIAEINTQIQAEFKNNSGVVISPETDITNRTRMLVSSAGSAADLWSFSIKVDPTEHNATDAANFNVYLGFDEATPDVDIDTLNENIGSTFTVGEFGKVTVDGVAYQVDRTAFEIDGVLYELKKEQTPISPATTVTPIDYTIAADTDKLVELVTGFVEAYNEFMGLISTALSEKQDPNNRYEPLTDEEKEDLSEDEIKNWEEKAKVGLLRGDTALISLSQKMRLLVFDNVYIKYGERETIGFGLENMGIDTKARDAEYNKSDNGKLYVTEVNQDIPERGLRYAIDNNLDKIVTLFTKSAETFEIPEDEQERYEYWDDRDHDQIPEHYYTPLYYNTVRRYADQTGGLGVKFRNLLDDYISRQRGADMVKGALIERAGMENDLSEATSTFSMEISRYQDRINALWDRYDRIEEERIQTLSRLEQVIQNAASQQSWMQGQMGGTA